MSGAGGIGPRIAALATRLFALRRSRFAADGSIVVVTQIVGKGTATILSLVLARMLTVEQFSIFTYLFVTATLLSSYIGLGLPFAISKVVAENRAEGSWARDDRIGAIVLVVAVVSAAAIALAPVYLRFLQSDTLPVPGTLIVVAALAMAWSGLSQAGLYGCGEFRATLAPVIAGTGVVLAVTALAVMLGNVTLLILGNIAGIVVPVCAYVLRLRRRGVVSRANVAALPGRSSVAEVLGIALPGLGVIGVYTSISWLIARVLVEQQATTTQFNQYALGLQWFSLVLFVPLAFGQILFPRYVQSARSGSLSAGKALVPAAATGGVILLCAVAGAFLAPLASLIYGSQYQFTALFVFTILFAAALSGMVNLLGSYVMAASGTGTWFAVNLASAGVAVGLLYVIPPSSAFEAARILCLLQITPLAFALAIVGKHGRRRATAARAAAVGTAVAAIQAGQSGNQPLT